MNRIVSAIALFAVSTTAIAQKQANFGFEGTVESVTDPLGVFESVFAGQSAIGSLVFEDHLAEQTETTDDPGESFVFYSGLSLAASIGDASFEATNPVVIAFNDAKPIDHDGKDGRPVDGLSAGAEINDLPAQVDRGSISALFEGHSDWFKGHGFPDLEKLGLDNLIGAEVIIKFRNPEPGTPGMQRNDELDLSEVVINITSVISNDGTIVTIGCRAFQFAPPYRSGDLSDVAAFLSEFAAGNDAADLAAPAGVIDLSDLAEFLEQYTNGCSI